MSGFSARNLTIDYDSTTLTGIRTRGFTITQNEVDVTNDDDNGNYTVLPDPGSRQIVIPVAGITTDEILIAEMMSSLEGRTLDNAQINLASSLGTPGTISGEAFIRTYEQTGEHDGAIEFTAELVMSGVPTFTASAA